MKVSRKPKHLPRPRANPLSRKSRIAMAVARSQINRGGVKVTLPKPPEWRGKND